MNRFDDYCCNYGCNQGDHCPARNRKYTCKQLGVCNCMPAQPAPFMQVQRQHMALHSGPDADAEPLEIWDQIFIYGSLVGGVFLVVVILGLLAGYSYARLIP